MIANLHYEIIRGLIDTGVCPGNAALAERLGTTLPRVEELLRELAEIHGVVLHPHACEPWVVHPFSTTPTLNWVEGGARSWWAPCVWCALGVSTLVGGRVRIHTRYGAEAEGVVMEVVDGVPVREDIWVHFAIPPRRAWDNVHRHCSLVLPFRSPASIREWCGRHGVGMGEAWRYKLSRDWRGHGTAPTRTGTGESGPWQRLRRYSSRSGCSRISGRCRCGRDTSRPCPAPHWG